MRVAFVGKGGAGKSTIAGTFARLLARRGVPVLAVDSDPMPGLAFSLGLERSDAGLPDDAVVERPAGEQGPRYRLRPDLSPAEAIERYAAVGPDGVRFLQFGKLRRAGDYQLSQMAFAGIRQGLAETSWNVVGDLPGGTRQPFFGWGDFAETILVVVEPTAKSLLSGRRLARLASGRGGARRVLAVASKVVCDGDSAAVSRGTGLPVVAEVPWDEEVAGAERRGLAPLDEAPGSPAVRAVEALLAAMLGERRDFDAADLDGHDLPAVLYRGQPSRPS